MDLDRIKNEYPWLRMLSQAALIGGATYWMFKHLSALSDPNHDQKYVSLNKNTDIKKHPDFWVNAQGIWIYKRSWLVPEAKAVIFLSHGFTEHCGRYAGLAAELNKAGYSVYSMDHQGHGMSGGTRAYVKDFNDYVVDFVQFMKDTDVKGLPRYILGHSMGGTIAMLTALQQKDMLEGLILSAPAICVDPVAATPTVKKLAHFFANTLPKMPLDKIDGSALSRDPTSNFHREMDPLIFRGYARSRFCSNMLRAMDNLKENVDQIDMPLLLLHGDKDKVVMQEGTEYAFANCSSEDKTKIIYEDYLHELFFELDRERVEADTLAWLEKRVK